MSFKYYDVNAITNIANTIRQKENTVNLMRVEDMPNHILNIQTGIEPAGSQEFNANGTYNVYNLAEAVVNVAGIEPTGTINIDANGTYAISNFATALVNVPLDPSSNIYKISDPSELDHITASAGDIAIYYLPVSTSPSDGIDGLRLPYEFQIDKSLLSEPSIQYDFNYESGSKRFFFSIQLEHYGEAWVDESAFRGQGQYQDDSQSLYIDYEFNYSCYAEDDNYVYFRDENGIEGETQDLEFPVTISSEDYSEAISAFLEACSQYKYEFRGAYQYLVVTISGSTEYQGWQNLKMGTSTGADHILNGYQFLSSDGMLYGTFGVDPVPTVSFVDNFLSNIQDAHWVASSNMIRGYTGCENIQSAPLISQMNTDLVTDASKAFQFCSNLLSIPNFNTSSVVNIASICDRCTSITSVPNWNTSKVTDMSYAFAYCSNLTRLPNYDTSNVVNMDSVVAGTTNIVIPNWNTSKVTSMNSAFYATRDLTLPNWDTSNVINAGSMFAQTNNLVFQNYNFSNVSYAVQMFQNCHNTTLKPSFNFSNVKNASSMFFWANNLTLVNYDFASVENACRMFIRLNTRTTTIDMFNNAHNITNVKGMFTQANGITTVGNIDTSKCNDFYQMFWYCNSLVNVPVFDMSNLSNLGYTLANMFGECNRLSNASITNIAKSLLTIPNSVIQNATANQRKITYNAYAYSSMFPGNVSWRFNTSTIGSSLYSQLQQKGFTL